MSDRVPTRFVRTLLRMVGDRGYDFSTVLSDAGLDFNPLDETDPLYRSEISAMQYSRVYQSVLSLLQDETFGTTGSELVAPGAFRMMCYCIISCRNLGQAIQRASEFYRTFFDEHSQLYANFSDQFARVGYRTMVREGRPRVEAADAYGLSLWHRFFGWLCGRPIELKRVDFTGDTPQRLEKYEELFGCPLYFNQVNDLLYFDSACLAWPVVHTEHSLREFLHTAPYQLLLMEISDGGNNLSAQVKAMIGHDFSEGFPAFETISSALHMSAPTLRRRLKREGTTSSNLKMKRVVTLQSCASIALSYLSMRSRCKWDSPTPVRFIAHSKNGRSRRRGSFAPIGVRVKVERGQLGNVPFESSDSGLKENVTCVRQWDRLATWMSPASLHMDVRFLARACPIGEHKSHSPPRTTNY